MRAAVIQFEVIPGNPRENRKKAERFLRAAKEQGAEFALLPELWSCGYRLKDLPALAETLEGPSVRLLQRLAAELRMEIVGGSIAEAAPDGFYNTSVAIGADGNLLGRYRKAHLFRLGLHEGDYFTAGNTLTLADFSQVRVGMAICYDLRFPEINRNLALRGARLLTFPAQWPAARVDDMRLIARVRAIENQCFVMIANVCGQDEYNHLQYSGHSTIINPLGEVLVDAPNEEGAFAAEVDLALPDQVRANINIFADRQPVVDEISGLLRG